MWYNILYTMFERGTTRRNFLIGLAAVGAGKLLLDSKPAQAQIIKPNTPETVNQTRPEFRWDNPNFPPELLKEEFSKIPEARLKALAGQEVYKIDPKMSAGFKIIRQLDPEMGSNIDRFVSENKQYILTPAVGERPEVLSVLEIRSGVLKPTGNHSFVSYSFEALEENGKKFVVHSLVIDAQNIDNPKYVTNGLVYLLGLHQGINAMQINTDYVNGRIADGATIEQLVKENEGFALVNRAIAQARAKTEEVYKRNEGFVGKSDVIDNMSVAGSTPEDQPVASAPDGSAPLVVEKPEQ